MRFQIAATLLFLATSISAAPAPGKDSDCDKTVKKGECIQDAINSAKRGDKIVVEAGEYDEQLTITTDGIQLIGKGAILVPPKGGYKTNFCTGLSKNSEEFSDGKDANAGICIHGKGFELTSYVRAIGHRQVSKPGNYVKDVVVSGFEVRGFTGQNIAVVGGQNIKINHNKLVDGAQYGFLTVGSIHTSAWKNVVTATPFAFIAMCMDDKSDTKFQENDISNYYIALCTQTPGALVKKNKAKNCCFGPFVDPGIKGAQIIENTISDRNPVWCKPFEGAGIAVYGASNTLVQGNTFENMREAVNHTGVGIYISDDPITGAKSSDNVFKNNILRNNDFDIFNNSTTTANKFLGNQCNPQLTSPPGLCGN